MKRRGASLHRRFPRSEERGPRGMALSHKAVPLCGSRKSRVGLGGVWMAVPRKESRPRRTSPEEEGSASPCRGGNAAHEKERKACSAVHFSRDAGGQCSVSRRPWQVLTAKKERGGGGSPAPPLEAAADARRLASPSPRPFIPMSRGAPAERGKRARVTSARRTFPRSGVTSARHELLLRAATSAAHEAHLAGCICKSTVSRVEKYRRRDMAPVGRGEGL